MNRLEEVYEIDNPEFGIGSEPKTITVSGFPETDPLRKLRKDGKIDDAQLEAGRRIGALCYRAELSPIKAMSYEEKIPGTAKEDFPFTFIGAVNELNRIRSYVGFEGIKMLRMVCLDGCTPMDITRDKYKIEPGQNGRARLFAVHEKICESLDLAAKYMKLK